MSLKKNIPIAFASINEQSTKNSQVFQNASTSNNPLLQPDNSNANSNSKIDNTVEKQITNLIQSIITPKLHNSPFNCLLIPIDRFLPDSLHLLKKHMLIASGAKDLFLGYAKDAEVLVLSSFLPENLNVFDSISNNESTLASHLTLSMQFNEFRGKLDLVLETLKIASSIMSDNSYQMRIQQAINLSKTDIMFNWKRMEDLKKYGNNLITGIRDTVYDDADRRISNGDILVDEIGVITETMESAFELLSKELSRRYINAQKFDNVNLNYKVSEVDTSSHSQNSATNMNAEQQKQTNAHQVHESNLER